MTRRQLLRAGLVLVLVFGWSGALVTALWPGLGSLAIPTAVLFGLPFAMAVGEATYDWVYEPDEW